MSFVTNEFQQISLFDSLGFLSKRKQQILEKSWAKPFSDYIFSNINEMIFAPLYSEKTNSRPNAPINVIVGALILKEFNGLTDDEILEECECDFRYQYALHTTSYDNQPSSDRTSSRFRERVSAYDLVTGEDLVHTCITDIADKIAKFMELSPTIKRMDSMMIESNIKKMGRLELLYTCLSNLVKVVKRDGRSELIGGLEAYADPDNRNRVVYYDRDTPQSERIQKVIDDASSLLPRCEKEYGNTDEYQLLLRAIEEQTKKTDKGTRIPKDKKDDMGSDILQNPADPEATFRVKAGKQHRGYSANITETVDAQGSVVTDYQYDSNTRSDASFIREYIDKSEKSEETTALITDGAYSGQDIQEQAAEKNIGVLSTGLLGRKPREILAEFEVSEDGTSMTACPEGHAPKSCSYNRKTDCFRISFSCDKCAGCPRRSECNPKLHAKTASIILSMKSRRRLVESQEIMDDHTRTLVGRIRNGVETTPSVIRNKYGVDKMPVRGRLKTKHFFGFKIAALNFTKLMRYLQGKEKCRAFC